MKYELVSIEWEDAYSGNHDWFKADSLPEAVEPLICYSTGFLIQDNEERVTIAQSFSHDSLANLWTIPKNMIRKMKIHGEFILNRPNDEL